MFLGQRAAGLKHWDLPVPGVAAPELSSCSHWLMLLLEHAGAALSWECQSQVCIPEPTLGSFHSWLNVWGSALGQKEWDRSGQMGKGSL